MDHPFDIFLESIEYEPGESQYKSDVIDCIPYAIRVFSELQALVYHGLGQHDRDYLYKKQEYSHN